MIDFGTGTLREYTDCSRLCPSQRARDTSLFLLWQPGAAYGVEAGLQAIGDTVARPKDAKVDRPITAIVLDGEEVDALDVRYREGNEEEEDEAGHCL